MQTETIRIMIVDDHEMVRETWRMLLHDRDGLVVIHDCGSGAEAISVAPALSPDILLIDINMAPVNGFEATRKILRQSPHLRIIGISVNNQPAYARNIMQLGARGYMTKNSSRDEMVRAIHAVMKGKTYVCAEVLAKMR